MLQAARAPADWSSNAIDLVNLAVVKSDAADQVLAAPTRDRSTDAGSGRATIGADATARAGWNGNCQPGANVLGGISARDGRSARTGRSEHAGNHYILPAKGPNDPAAFEPAMA